MLNCLLGSSRCGSTPSTILALVSLSFYGMYTLLHSTGVAICGGLPLERRIHWRQSIHMMYNHRDVYNFYSYTHLPARNKLQITLLLLPFCTTYIMQLNLLLLT